MPAVTDVKIGSPTFVTAIPASPVVVDREIGGDWTIDDGPLVCDGRVTIGGSARKGAQVRATGVVKIGGNAEAADIVSAAEILLATGSIVGGSASAYALISCQAAGDTRGTSTELSIGIDSLLLDQAEKRAEEIVFTRGKAADMRGKLEPMLRGVKGLTSVQREKVTCLLDTAYEADARADAATTKLVQKLKASVEQVAPKIIVAGSLFTGVRLLFPGLSAPIETTIKGPVEITARRQGSAGCSITVMEVASRASWALRTDLQSGRIERILKKLGQD